MSVHKIIISNNQKVEKTQISITQWMDKQNMVYLYNGKVFSHKKQWITDIYYKRGWTLKTLYSYMKEVTSKYHLLFWVHIYMKHPE